MLSNTVVRYFVDLEKIDKRRSEGIDVQLTLPIIKNTGFFSDAGIDLFAAYNFVVDPHSKLVVDTFVGVIMDAGVAGFVWPRGGDDFLVGAGVIDTGYTGTIKVKIINPYSTPMSFIAGDSVGQLVLFKKGVDYMPELQQISFNQINKVKSEQYRERQQDGRINKDITLV